MFEYKFVKVDVFSLNGQPKEDYQCIVHEHAKEGWRLHQILTPPFGHGGQALFLELIFEKSVD